MESSLDLRRRAGVFRYVSRQFAALTPPTGRAFARRAVALASASRRFGTPSGGKLLTERGEASATARPSLCEEAKQADACARRLR